AVAGAAVPVEEAISAPEIERPEPQGEPAKRRPARSRTPVATDPVPDPAAIDAGAAPDEEQP
ncbi:MAG: NADH:ubiquinone oxidoreductase, partial [Candidatus Dormibacteria bacterium]